MTTRKPELTLHRLAAIVLSTLGIITTQINPETAWADAAHGDVHRSPRGDHDDNEVLRFHRIRAERQPVISYRGGARRR